MKSIVFVVGLAVSTIVAAGDAIFRSESCQCCSRWAAYMEQAGFPLKDRPTTGLKLLKQRWNVPPSEYSCHTAVIDGYLIEGHVPVEAVRRLLDERPRALGLSVPGMPVGSPGMEGPNPVNFHIHLIKADRSIEEWGDYPAR